MALAREKNDDLARQLLLLLSRASLDEEDSFRAVLMAFLNLLYKKMNPESNYQSDSTSM
jgi:hypothetical protein